MVYTALGGLVADVVSDILQFALLWGSTVAVTVVLAIRLQDRDLLAAVDPGRLRVLDFAGHGLGDGATFAFWPMLIGGFFLYVSYYGCDQTQAQRILAAADANQARRALAVASLARFPLVFTYCLFGLLLACFLVAKPEFASSLAGAPPDALVPQFLVNYLPTGLVGLVVAGILAAALSSIDSALNSLSAVTVEEFSPSAVRDEGGRRLWWARWTTVGWGVAATTAAWCFSRSGETSIELVNRVGSALYGPVLAVFVLAWRSRRADGPSVVAGAIAGLLANLALAAWAPGVSWLWWNVVGCVVALAVAVALGRAGAPVEPVVTAGGRLARLLIAYFVAILLLLAALTVAV
jgi:SSS family solute:Na+ symporter